jgi:hypothetical protein
MGQPVDISTTTSRLRSKAQQLGDGQGAYSQAGRPRVDPYGGGYVAPVWFDKKQHADEGSYFVAHSPTPGTAVAYALQTTYSDTANGLFVFQNNAPVGSNINCAIDYLRLIQTATAPTGTLAMDFVIRTDSVAMTPTANSLQIAGGQTANYIFNTNHNDNTPHNMNIWAFSAGAMTVPASSASARRVGRPRIVTGVTVTHDVFELQFGAVDRNNGSAGLTAARATAPANMIGHCAPFILQPQQWGVVLMWWITAAANTPSFEYEIGMVIR